MRLFFVFSFLFITGSAITQSKIDVLHYKYSIELNDNNDSIYGKAEIKLKLLQSASTIKFDLVKRNGSGKGMVVDSITGPAVRGFVKDQDSIRIILMPGTGPLVNDTAIYIVRYHGVPADGLIISKNKYGHRTFFADNWPNRAHNWIPCVDDPADKASVEFIVTAPSHYQVISNGVQVEETNLADNKKLTHYKEDVPLPTKVMVIGVAEFAVQNAGMVNCVPVYSWVYPEDKKDGFYDYALAKNILSFFDSYIGPYPYKKLANVQSKTIFGGMENAGAIFYAESTVTGDRSSESLLAHEIVHQWFGDMATEKSFAHLWLSEGFATYLAHLYDESKYGLDKFSNDMKAERDEIIAFVKSSRKPVVDSVSPYMQLLNTNSYQKGSWVLHMLRRQLGDSVFRKSIRTYYAKFAGKNADTRDLQKVFESVSGKDLDQFFTQWLYTPECPQLEIKWKYLEKEQKLSVTVKQLQQTVFQMPLQISIVTSQGMRTPRFYKIEISKAVETFLLPTGKKPHSVQPDMETSLLAEFSVSETK
ncbi:MAG: M1 family metallopeptidase [Chitinophagaceae bacterium]